MLPPVLHTVWINKNIPFSQMEYISLLTAVKRTNLQVVLHTNLKPGESPYCPYRIHGLEVRETVFETEEIKGKPVRYIAHAVDWFKINKAIEVGGLWADLDIYWLQSLSHLTEQPRGVSVYQCKSRKTVAIGFFGCLPGDEGLQKLRDVWYSSKTYWKFANLYKYQTDWLLLDTKTLFPWAYKKLEFLHNKDYKINLKSSLGVHLWGHQFRSQFTIETTPLANNYLSLTNSLF